MVNDVSLRVGGIRRINQRQLQDTKVELALSVGTCHGTLVRLCCRDELQWSSSDGMEHRKRKVVPVDNNSKVVPAWGGEWDRE